MLSKIKDYIIGKIHLADEIARAKSVDIIESEITQLEYIFSVLTFGEFLGYPSVPSQIMFELLSESEDSINLLLDRINTQNEPLAELISTFRID
ncbi:MAG: hypothetical protein KDC88_05015 [Ignavibacteriae bacterium]|nr:hypothetical protein [Ignavibacteriota bacterium]MCB9208489.1 hypothetical protein [Ignavibacteriales bacterium]MCB9258402.1 hypothetical protein [Ignavibacteriales bacterium]